MAKKITRGKVFDKRGRGKFQTLYRGDKIIGTIRVGNSDYVPTGKLFGWRRK